MIGNIFQGCCLSNLLVCVADLFNADLGLVSYPLPKGWLDLFIPRIVYNPKNIFTIRGITKLTAFKVSKNNQQLRLNIILFQIFDDCADVGSAISQAFIM